ncbi:MAG: glycosyltransferase, partial [Selenomonadaceae bacterium]|nr:glycosyltransferase [Selenomonadaceae bacterium]
MTFENFIPPRSKSVLEITGEIPDDFESTQEKFLEIQPACDYTVSENLGTLDKKFDAILFQSAAIDNLKNSELVELIKKAGEFLNPRGRLIFTLNNIGYAENVMAILEGKPLKFKTTLSRVELEEAIKAAGLNDFNPLNAGRRVPVARGVVEASKIDVSVFAYILSATPEELPPKTSIQTAIGERIVCGAKRVFDPANFISTEPNISTFFHDGNDAYRLLNSEAFPTRIFINQRISFNSFTEGKIFFERMKESGYLYVEEMDDNPILWREGYDRNGWINFIGVHAIQTSTEYLADVLKQFNPHIKIFANQLRKISPLRDFREESKKNLPVRIFFGAINRDKDFQDILPILNDFAQKYGDRLEFKIIANKELYEALQSKNKILAGDPNFYNGQFIPYEKYEKTLRESDIALLPLLDNEFNRCKSDLKFIECGGCGAAVLASPVV